MRTKNTLLYDFMEIFKSINCDSLYCNCNDCSNKKLCDTVEDVIKNMANNLTHPKTDTKHKYKEIKEIKE